MIPWVVIAVVREADREVISVARVVVVVLFVLLLKAVRMVEVALR